MLFCYRNVTLLQMCFPVTYMLPCYRHVTCCRCYLLHRYHPVTGVFPCYRCVTCYRYVPLLQMSPCYRCVPLLQICHPVTDVFPCYRYVPLLQMCSPVTDVLLSTVHKAKGLEFSTVKITDDFVDLYNTLRNRFSKYPSCWLLP